MKSFRIAVCLLALFLVSCASVTHYYDQVYTIKNDDSTFLQSDGFVWDDENCRITYSFWGKNGDASFVFFNQSNEIIQIDLASSFFVLNNFARDYSIENPPIVLVPPHTYRIINGVNIIKFLYKDCVLKTYPTTIDSVTFTIQETPINFSTTITYKKGETTNVVENRFYVSQIVNYPEEKLYRYVPKKDPCNPKKVYKDIYDRVVYDRILNISTEDKFYCSYDDNPIEQNTRNKEGYVYFDKYGGWIKQEYPYSSVER